MSTVCGSPLTSTVDWLTVTAAGAMASARLLADLMDLVGIDFLTHEKKRPWYFMGFRGQAYEGLRYGSKDDYALVMLSGSLAARLWRLVAPLRTKCTRVDMAVTVALTEPDYGLVERGYEAALALDRVQTGKVVNSRGGTTLYVGSRKSMYFGRLYDKGAEQASPAGLNWRYEVECKKPASEVAVSRLLQAEEPGTFALAFVHNFFTQNGVEPIFEATNTECAIEIEARVTSDEKSLEWLSSQVRPTVSRLLINGREAELLEALGLPDYVKPQVSDLFGGV